MPEERPRTPKPTVTVPRWIQLVTLPLLVLGLWAIARAAGPVFLLFAVAAVIALVLNPLVRQIERARLPRGLAIAVVYVGFFTAIAGVAVLLADPIGDQIATFRHNVPDYVDDANRGLDNIQGWLDRHDINIQV